MKKHLVIVVLVLSLVLNVIIGIYFVYSNRSLSDAEIKEKFNCDRVTLDVKDTDVFCRNPDIYRQAFE